MRSVTKALFIIGLFGLTVGCAEKVEVPAEMTSIAETTTEALASPWSVPGWRQSPTDQPAGYEGTLEWEAYLEGRSVRGDFNGDGMEDTAILFERDPEDSVLESMYGDRAQEVKGFVLEFGLFAFLSSPSGEVETVDVTSRVNGIGLYGLDMRPGGDGQADAIDFIKYDSSNFLYRWNAATSSFEEEEEGD